MTRPTPAKPVTQFPPTCSQSGAGLAHVQCKLTLLVIALNRCKMLAQRDLRWKRIVLATQRRNWPAISRAG